MASETITRNDLTAILNEVLPPKDEEIEDISNKITLGGAWTNLGKVAYRVGKVCYFYMDIYAGTIVGGTQYTVATIASGYRPKFTVCHTGHATNSSYVAQSIVNNFVWTSGDITIRASNGNGNYVFISGWWILP